VRLHQVIISRRIAISVRATIWTRCSYLINAAS
jgi:hypothetical protein